MRAIDTLRNPYKPLQTLTSLTPRMGFQSFFCISAEDAHDALEYTFGLQDISAGRHDARGQRRKLAGKLRGK